MQVTRRGFLGAVAAVPLLGKVVSAAKTVTYQELSAAGRALDSEVWTAEVSNPFYYTYGLADIVYADPKFSLTNLGPEDVITCDIHGMVTLA